jgi:hypothetical protein
MSHRALQRLITTAVTDPEFCSKLLNGDRPTLLTDFDFTDREREVLLSIGASSLQEFAARLDEWLQSQKSPVGSPNWGRMPHHYDYGRFAAGRR